MERLPLRYRQKTGEKLYTFSFPFGGVLDEWLKKFTLDFTFYFAFCWYNRKKYLRESSCSLIEIKTNIEWTTC